MICVICGIEYINLKEHIYEYHQEIVYLFDDVLKSMDDDEDIRDRLKIAGIVL